MRDYMDDLLRQALQPDVHPADRLERDTVQKMTDSPGEGSVSPKKLTERGLRPVLAAFCLVLLLGSAATAYAATNGLTVGELFVHIWKEQSQGASLEDIGSKVNVLSEESTFQDISIEPVKAVSDPYITYVILKVEGKNGFKLTDEMAFDNFSMENRQEGASGLCSFVLKREGNTMYVALQMSTLEIKKYRYQKFTIDLYNLHHAVLDEMGRCVKVKHMIQKPGEEEGTFYDSYSEKSIAAKGEYHAEIVCTVRNDKVEISTEDSGTFEVYTLGVFVDKDIDPKVNNIMNVTDWEKRGIFVVMTDGSEVQAVPDGGYSGICSAFELREPIDPDKVRGVRILDEIYERDL